MVEWIHVLTASKMPLKRGSQSSPFEFFADGYEPNDNPFGPGYETQFLPVTRETPPTVNPVLLKVVQSSTVGLDDVAYPGEYDANGQYAAGDWVVSYSQETQDLPVSKALKLDALATDREAAFDVGYSIGEFVFPFTETFFRQLADRHYWLDIAINDGAVPSNAQITFSDRTGKEVSVGLAGLRSNFRQYGLDYLRIFEIDVDARDEINAAADPAGVDAATWDFSEL